MSVLARTYALPSGDRVRLRLARPSDARAVAALLGYDELRTRRLLAFDPSSRAVKVALTFEDGAEAIVGLGAVDLDDGVLEVLAAGPAGLEELLVEVLAARGGRRRVA